MNLNLDAPAAGLDLALSRTRIAETLAPFVAREIGPGDEEEWRAVLASRGRKILKRRLHRQFMGWMTGGGRGPDVVQDVYGRTWQETTLARLVDTDARAVPCVWGHRRMMAAAPGLKRVHLLHLTRLIDVLRPKSVLEVGCGMGVNLFVLAARFPEIRFHGIDLTASGIEAIRAMAEHENLPQYLLDYCPEPSRDPGAHRRIEVRQGSAAALPYDDNGFDLIYSISALEQMEAIRVDVMRQLKRVAKGHVAMVEAFRDWNRWGMRRNYIVAQDYFACRLNELPGYGLQPLLVSNDMPSKVNMAHGLVVASA
ncbi:MAG: class I SAM-dependent methyltransferase [Alphaproteobacteria bacterium]|jgi:SAM-dependent methyltransferase|nr:class I SAM-dependent methyltransferase [Alphaproteobacteria bacterium]MDP6829676.1 class I SAM-dependent methyltransferase [Alphaproteobacteria bacterium]